MEIWFKQKTRPRMNYERIRKTLKKTDQKIEKNYKKSKRDCRIKRIFYSNTVFSLYFKLGAKKSRRKDTRFSAPLPLRA